MIIGGTTGNLTMFADGIDSYVMRISETGYIEWYSQMAHMVVSDQDYILSVAINSVAGGYTGYVYAIF